MSRIGSSLALGAIRIDLIADIAKFVSGSKAGTKELLKWRDSAKSAVKDVGAHVNAAAKTFVNMKTAILGVGVALGAMQVARGLDAAADKVDQLGKAAKRLGVGVEQLSALRFAAGESGVEFESLAKMAARAGRTVAEMVDNGKTFARVGRINVALTDAAGNVRNIADLLPDLARGIESAGSEAAQLNLAQKFFGRDGAEGFITFLKESGTFVKGLADQTERARKLGVIFTDEQVEKLTAYRDAVGRVQEAWLGVKVKMMTEVAPALTRMLDDMALRTAAIPRTAGAIAAALGASGTSDAQGRLAGRLLSSVGAGVRDVLLTSARASANLFVTILTEGVRAAGVTMAIEFGKALRGTFPWIDILAGDATTGSAAEVARLKKQRAALLTAQGQVAAMPKTDPSSIWHYSPDAARVRSGLDSRVEEVLNRRGGTVEEAVAALDKLIAARERYVQLDEGAVAQQRAQALAESARRVAESWTTGMMDVERAIAGASDAIDKLNTNFASSPAGELLGPPVTDGGSTARQEAKRQYDEFVNSLRQLRDTGVQVWDAYTKKVEAGLKKTEPLYKANVKRVQDLREELDALTASLDPYAERTKMAAVALEGWKAGLITLEEYSALIDKIYAKAKNLGDKAKDTFGDKVQDAITGFSDNASDALADLAMGADVSFEAIAESFNKMLLKMAINELAMRPLFAALGSAIGTPLGTTPAGTPTAPKESAHGNAFGPGGIIPFASGGIVSRPTYFRFARGTGLMGEAGPEAIMPLTRIGGDLGVKASGGGVLVQVIDQRSGGAPVGVSESTGGDGRRQISILIRDEVRRQITGGGLDQAMDANYGVRRRPAGR